LKGATMAETSTIEPTSQLRIARPSNDLAAAERFYVDGLGFSILQRGRGTSTGERNLLMVGLPGAAWHVELIHDTARTVEPVPSPDDLLVLYLGAPADPALIARIEQAGGKRVPAYNPWWDQIGVTIEDPDGYRLVLCERVWSQPD
jgi:catechol 2,3-dioxygenase-like lactoylglutathione lyase family enzyme